MRQVADEVWVDPGIEPGSEASARDLYRARAVAAGVEGFSGVSDEQVARFHREGYLVIDDAFTADEVQAALEGLLDLIDGKIPAFTGVQFEAKARERLDSLAREEKQDAVRKLIGFVEHEPRTRAIAEHTGLIGVLRRIIGEEPALFQDQALLKPPFIGREKPWHQDNAFFSLPPEATIVGVWIALDEAVSENGCMHVIPGTHRQGPVVHFQRRDWQLCDEDVAVAEVVAAPLRPGGCLLFHGLLHHGTPPSQSPRRRRALQYHYKPASVGRTSEEERLAVFGSEGKDVTC